MKFVITYITASTSPHARLQAIAAARTDLTSSWLPPVTRRALVSVRTIMRPKRTSEVRSMGSRKRCDMISLATW